jgi:hypothetical protein
MERGVDHSGLDALGQMRVQGGLARAAGQRYTVAFSDAAFLGVVRIDLEYVFGVPDIVFGSSGLRADIVLSQNATGGEQQRELCGSAFVGWDKFCDHEAALAADEAADVHNGRAFRRFFVARPLHAAELVELTPAKVGVRRAISVLISDGWE